MNRKFIVRTKDNLKHLVEIESNSLERQMREKIEFIMAKRGYKKSEISDWESE